MSTGSDFIASLSPASFRGVPFGVTESKKTFGRRTAPHEYPFRDTQWDEDLGRRPRLIQIQGFLVSNSLIYGGGDVLGQEQKLIAAAETAGPGKLVHPTLGELNVTCHACVTGDSLTAGVITVDFDFYEAGEKIFPSIAAASGAAVASAAGGADAAASGDLSMTMAGLLSVGPSALAASIAAIASWTAPFTRLALDATSLFNLASQLPGAFGRFFNGRNLGGLVAGVTTVFAPDTTLDQLIATAAGVRSAVGAAIGVAVSVGDNLGLGDSNNSPADLAAAAQALCASLLASTTDPADGIRLLAEVAGFTPPSMVSMTPAGAAIGDLFRRAAVVAIARASATYQPWSYDDAVSLRTAVAGYIDAEIQVAGDEGDDASFTALSALRVAVVQDLTTRGATLARMTAVTSPEPEPALALAQRLYRDPSRADQLVTEAQPVHPLFMPTSFQALAA
jgi:prophage DNA circulation protein